MRRLCLSAALALTLALTLSAADWPRFRGPNGTGVAAGPLPPVDAKSALWKVAIPGRGNSSPVVVGGKLFVQSASADGSRRLLLCLDATTGKTLWTKELPGKKAHTHGKNSMASATPAADGERVYCVSWDGDQLTLLGYDLAGKELWRQPLGGFVSQHGPGHSPAVYDGLVYISVDEDANLGGKAVLTAFDARTGQKKWAVDRKPYRASYSTPFLLTRPNRPTALVMGTTTAITGYDPKTGKTLWEYPIEWPDGQMPLRVVGSPVYANGVIVCYCGDGGGSRYTVAIDPDGKAPTKVWEVSRGKTPYVPCMLSKGDLLFWVSDAGIATCVEARTGKPVWEERVSAASVTASPILVGDDILVIAEGGQASVIKADRAFDLVRKEAVGEAVSASPAVADGKVFVRGANHLFCFGTKLQ